MLCDTCQRIFSHYCEECEETFDQGNPYTGHYLPHHSSFDSLQKASEASCQICIHLIPFFVSTNTDKVDPVTSVRIWKSSESQGFGLTIFGHKTSPDQPGSKNVARTFLAISEVLIEPTKTHGLSSDQIVLPDSTDSVKLRAQMREWISDCCHKHRSSRRTRKNFRHYMPTRLLQVSGLSGDDQIRLVNSADHFDNTRTNNYMTLSHRWGKGDFLKLEKFNKTSLQSSILLKSLPKTYRDAVEVTRWLGVQYLWIDSLCIVQDDVVEWRLEASHMADVYSFSYCNIASTGAFDASHGLWFPRDPKMIEATIVQPLWPQAAGGSFVVMTPAETIHHQFITQPLMSRAWVVQERILAPRALHFSPSQVFWECEHMFACEAIPKNFPTDFADIFSDGGYFNPWNNNITYWDDLIQVYSSCSLTYPGDKLIALSGVARRAHELVPKTYDVYLAGMWKSSIFNNLLWHLARLEHPPRKLYRGSEYRAPSWSWASVDGRINNFFIYRHQDKYVIQPLATLDSYNIQTACTDPFGQVLSARLTLNGFVFRVCFSNIAVQEPGGLSQSEVRIESMESMRGDILKEAKSLLNPYLRFDDLTVEKGIASGEKYDLPFHGIIIRSLQPLPGVTLNPQMHGLILRETRTNEFERVGIFQLTTSITEMESMLSSLSEERIVLI